MKFGLCCISIKLAEQGVRYRKIFFKTFSSLPPKQARKKLYDVWLNNIQTLRKTIEFCAEEKIARYRIPSDIFPLATHPKIQAFEQSEIYQQIKKSLAEIGDFARTENIGLSFHPSQFISIASANKDVRIASIKDINFNSQILDLLNAPADVRSPINIHLNRQPPELKAIHKDFSDSLTRLTQHARKRLTIENEDKGFWNFKNLLEFLKPYKIPLLFDLHHNRLNPSEIGEEQAIRLASKTWNPFTPIFHISSSDSKNPRKHADYCKKPLICFEDDSVIMVEAKAKDYAIKKLMESKQ